MKKPTVIRIIGTIAVPAFAAIIAWCGGYNFDRRDSDVAMGVGVSLIFTIVASIVPYEDLF